MSFRVVCIDSAFKKEALLFGSAAKELIEGEVYTVIQVIPPIVKDEGYVLQEIKSSHPTGAFLASRFAPLSNIDETEYSTIKETEKL